MLSMSHCSAFRMVDGSVVVLVSGTLIVLLAWVQSSQACLVYGRVLFGIGEYWTLSEEKNSVHLSS